MIKRFLKNGWAIAVGSILLLRLIDWIAINDFFWDKIKLIFRAIIEFFTVEYSLKLYIIILIPIITIFILYIINMMLDNKEPESEITLPDWINYKKDVFDNVQYRWNYTLNKNNQYEICDISPYCDDCSCLIIDKICPNCKNSFYDMWGGSRVKSALMVNSLIVHRIENDLYTRDADTFLKID